VTEPVHPIEIARRAERDLRKLSRQDMQRVRDKLAEFVAGAENVDVKALQGRSPWLRLRVGELRVLLRPLTQDESTGGTPQWLIARVIARRELERAVASLDP
jgi:mRNA-degrading endonuclease RelE of RelBE toxin-antitoxin system